MGAGASSAPDPVSPAAVKKAAARDPYTVKVTPQMRQHQAWDDGLYFGGAALGWLVLLGVLGLGVSRRVRDLAARVTVRPFWLGAAFWIGQRAVDAATRRWGPRWGFLVPSDPAALPLLLLVLGVLVFLGTPALNAVSRTMEHQADTFALELTRDGDAGARAFVKLAEGSKKLPDPHPLIRFLRYAHPTIAERIAFCRSYRPWERGQPNRVFTRHASPRCLPCARGSSPEVPPRPGQRRCGTRPTARG